MHVEEISRATWRWPRFSLRVFLAVITIYAIFIGYASTWNDRNEAISSTFGSVVLGWFIFCWYISRINREWIVQRTQARKRKHCMKETRG
jgi:hypothetical protein